MNDLWMVIPTAKRHQYIPEIIKESRIDPNHIVIVHTVNDNKPFDDVHNVFDIGDINIHRWWNKGIDYAQQRGARYVAVVNDDIMMLGGPLQKIVKEMQLVDAVLGYPTPFQGWVCGYCWVLDLASDVRPDENYRWWYGDRDIDIQAKNNGGVIHVPAMVRHLHGNQSTDASAELTKLTEADEDYFFSKWNLKKA
jgi:hypothetical protein